MATWTQADIDAIRTAIMSLVTGTSVVTVSYNGPPARSVTYQEKDLVAMRALLAEMQQAVNAAAGTPSYRLAATRKGF